MDHAPAGERFPPPGRATAQGEIGGLTFFDRIAALADDLGRYLAATGFVGLALLGKRKPRFQHPPVSRPQKEHADLRRG
jgi:hypothetical protein